MESKPEELKSTTDAKTFEPWLDLAKALDELKIDYKADDFSERDMIHKLTEKSIEPGLHFWEQNRYKDLISVLAAHRFWESEPIMLYRHKMKKEGEIRQIKPTDVPQEPLPLPPGFEWSEFDITNDEEVEEICKFLEEHYVEDELGNFRVIYKKEKFRWAVMCPGYKVELHTLIRNSKNKKIMGLAKGEPKKAIINGRTVKVVEGNFLCVH